MANANAPATSWNNPNYVGELFLVGQNKTPFLNMIGGLGGGRIWTVNALQFPMAQPWALEAASQPAITETASLTAPTAWTYVRGVDYNTCQIFQRTVSMSYVGMSEFGQVSADATTGRTFLGDQPVKDEYGFQKAAALKQIAIDVEYTFLNGTYAQATAANVAAKTRGIITGITTNTLAAAGAALTPAMINTVLRTMAASGAEFNNMVMFANSWNKQAISAIYGYAPEDRNIGGVNIKQVETDFAMLGIVWDPFMPAGTVLIADMGLIQPVFCPVPGKGVLFYEDLAKTGAGTSGQIYGQIGINYGPEEMHGTITGTATA